MGSVARDCAKPVEIGILSEEMPSVQDVLQPHTVGFTLPGLLAKERRLDSSSRVVDVTGPLASCLLFQPFLDLGS